MKLRTLAVRDRGQNIRFLFPVLLLALVSLYNEKAFCASLVVKVQQINPQTVSQQITCSENTKCVVPIAITEAGQSQTETLNVSVEFVPGNVLVEFQTPKGFLYAADQNGGYTTMLRRGPKLTDPSTDEVVLFLPAVPRADLAPILKTAQGAVATLEITTQQVQ